MLWKWQQQTPFHSLAMTVAAGLFIFDSASAQNQFTIGLNINGAKYDTVYLNEPLIFTVTLSNKYAEYDLRHKREAQAYLDDLKLQLDKAEIKQEYYEAELKRVQATMKEPKEISVGTKSRPWAEMVEFSIISAKGDTLSLKPELFKYPAQEDAALLNESSYHRAAYGAEGKLAAGDYTVNVRIQNENPARARLTVLSQKIPDNVMNSEAMLLHFGDYHSLRGDNAKALEYAGKLISLYPAAISGHILRADTYLRMEKWSEALVDYETALRLFNQQYPGSFEQPEYALEMIEFVKGKMR